MDSPVQLSLGIALRDDATFDSFYVADAEAALLLRVLHAVAAGEERNPHVIWGAPGCGLSHLLQATCHRGGAGVQYLPLRDILGYAADDICEGLEETPLVCLDGIDLICGNREWELALFHLYNRLRDAGHRLVMASHTSPAALPLLLKDLKSRVLGSVVFHVRSLDDAEKQAALIMRAQLRGMVLSEDVARYILSRCSRNMNDLFDLLNRLDEESLQQQRKLTIPFVKDILQI